MFINVKNVVHAVPANDDEQNNDQPDLRTWYAGDNIWPEAGLKATTQKKEECKGNKFEDVTEAHFIHRLIVFVSGEDCTGSVRKFSLPLF